ncbi:MAG: adenosine kinase [Pseudomonadota bacterium]|nr:adenosine kinase [Pseudomonadota bacterium]MDE3036860.1 adenosine kinase [Pseudomonadota bacterium]
MSKRSTDILFDVVGIGNAIVDVLAFTDEAFLTRHRLNKNTMTLVDEARAEAVYRKMGQTTECSGGSVANTLAGMASLGARTAFIGKVKNDQLGSIFIHDLHAVGVHFSTMPLESGPSTANCLVCVTPDAHRTMATFIGACSQVAEEDIDEEIIAHASVVYIEGYLWDTENAKAAIRKAITLAKETGRKIAFTLSDVFCVDRHRAEFLELIKNDIDILFANEAELKSLYQTDDVEQGLSQLKGACPVAAVTRSERGSVVLSANGVETVPTEPVARIVDTTGAGDLYASGFLFGFTRGRDLSACAALGNRCAGEIIQQLGARSMRPLKNLVA